MCVCFLQQARLTSCQPTRRATCARPYSSELVENLYNNRVISDARAVSAMKAAGPARRCSPRHSERFEPSFLELNRHDMTWRATCVRPWKTVDRVHYVLPGSNPYQVGRCSLEPLQPRHVGNAYLRRPRLKYDE